MLIVILASGPDKGQVHEFSDNETVVLGRTTGPIQFTDSKISRQHVQLWCEGGQWFCRDLDSRHGSYRNNKPITGPRTQIKDGDRLQIGRTVLVMSRMPVEQARKLELLADPDNAPMELPDESADASTAHRSTATSIDRAAGRRPASMRPVRDFAVGLAAAAAIALVGLNIFMLIDARRQNAALRQQFAKTAPLSPATAIDPTALVTELKQALSQHPDETRQMLRDVLVAVQAAPTREQFDAVAKQFADTRTADAKRQDLLESILAEVKAQQGVDPHAVAKLDEVLTAVHAQPKLTETLVHEQLSKFEESRQTQANILHDLFAAVQAQPEQLQTAQTEIVAAIKAQPQPEKPTDVEPLLQQVLAKLEEQGKTDEAAIAQMMDAVAAQPQATREMLDQVLAKLDAQPKPAPDPRLDEVLTAVQREPKDIEPLLKQMLTTLDAQTQSLAKLDAKSDREQMVEAIKAAIVELPAKQAQATREMLDQVLAKLDAQPKPAPDPRLDEVLAAVQRDPKDIEPLLKQMLVTLDAQTQSLAKLDAKPDREQMVEAIKAATAELPAKQAQATREMLAQVQENGDAADDVVLTEILQSVQRRPTSEQLSAAIDTALKNHSPRQEGRDGEVMLREVLAAVNAKPTQEQLAAVVEEKLNAHSEVSDSLLKMLYDELKDRPTQAQLDQALATRLEPGDQTVKRILENLSAPRDTSQQQMLADILAAVKVQPQQTLVQLQQVLVKLEEKDKADQAAIAHVLEAVAAQPQQSEPLLRQIAAKLDAADKLDTDAKNADLLKQIAAAVESQPVQTKAMVEQILAKLDKPADAGNEAMLKEILAAVKEREALQGVSSDTAVATTDTSAIGGDRNEQLLRQVLAELRSRSEPIAQAVLDGVRADLREQVQLALAQTGTTSPKTPAQPVSSPGDTAVARRDTPGTSTNVSIYPNVNPLAAFDPQRQSAVNKAAPGEMLTDTQLAYKRAWETGLPEMVGGRLDPVTGRRVDGRSLDPTRARSMGIGRWQDWYMIDDLAEQERLRLAATQFAAAKPSPLTTPLYQIATGQAQAETEAGAEAQPTTTPKRIVFVLDASESLGAALPIALDRLNTMIDDLADDDAFTVMLYQDRNVTEVPPRGLKPATLKAAEHVIHWLRPNSGNLRPRGHSNPIGALQQAMRLKPDDIYLISAQLCGSKGDALAPAPLLAGIQKLSPDPRIRLHGVELFRADSKDTLKRLTQQYGGTYRFIPTNGGAVPGGAEAPVE